MEHLRNFGANFVNSLANKNKIPPDDLLVSCRKQLTDLKDEIILVKQQFANYSHQVVEAAEASVTLSKSVKQFYSKANHPGRTESVNMYAKVQEDIANRAVNTFHITVENGLISELSEWISLIAKIASKINEAENTRITAHDTQNRLASLQNEYQEKKLKKNTFFSANRENEISDLQNRITEAANLQKSLFAEYQKTRNQIAQKVKQMMTSRYVQFDRIYVQMLECQAEYFQHTNNISKRFQRDIDYYRKQYPKANHYVLNNGGPQQQQQQQQQKPLSPNVIKASKSVPVPITNDKIQLNGNLANTQPINNNNNNDNDKNGKIPSNMVKQNKSKSQNNSNRNSPKGSPTHPAVSPAPNNAKKKPKLPTTAPPSYNQYKKTQKTVPLSPSPSPNNISSNGHINNGNPRGNNINVSSNARFERQPSTHRNFLGDFTNMSKSPQPPKKQSSAPHGNNILNNNNNNNNNNDDDPFGDMFSGMNDKAQDDHHGILGFGQPPQEDFLNFTSSPPTSANNSSSQLKNQKKTQQQQHNDIFGDIFGSSNNKLNKKTSPHKPTGSVSDFLGYDQVTSPTTTTTKKTSKPQQQQPANDYSRSNDYQTTAPISPSTTKTIKGSNGAHIQKQIVDKQLSAAEQKRADAAAKIAMDKRNEADRLALEEKAQEEYWKTKHEVMLLDWEFENHVRRNVRTLIQRLPDIIPKKLEWKPIPLNKLLNDAQVKKGYYKAVRLVHPDKSIGRGDDVEAKVICAAVFQALEQAFNKQFN